MHGRPSVYSSITLNAGELSPAFHVDLDDEQHCIRLVGNGELQNIYLDGTLDELAKFVLDLAGVVREINARELDRDARRAGAGAIGTGYADDDNRVTTRQPCPACNETVLHAEGCSLIGVAS